MLELGNPRAKAVRLTGVQVSQADGGSLARSQLGGSSLQSLLCFVSVLSAPTGDEVSLRKMMVMAD